ncbi:MAG TPA: hypothetical protein VMQ62_04895 [Dongiaceae bacterium]|nr:hypothetical protein [Dongiaceae bacterium]
MLILAMGSLVVFLVMVHLIVGRTCRENRSVLLQVPIEAAWEALRDFGALHAAHGRGRPLMRIESSTLKRGDGLDPGSIWRQEGTWNDAPFWSEIEVVESEAPRRIVVSLRGDSFGTQAGLMRHRCEIDLAPFDARSTRLRLRMTARLNNLRLVLARTLSPERMHSRLLDLGLRSLKLAIEGAGVTAPSEPYLSYPAPADLRFGGGAEAAVDRPLPAMLPEWIKPEVAAAALYNLGQDSREIWAAAGAEGALDRP